MRWLYRLLAGSAQQISHFHSCLIVCTPMFEKLPAVSATLDDNVPWPMGRAPVATKGHSVPRTVLAPPAPSLNYLPRFSPGAIEREHNTPKRQFIPLTYLRTGLFTSSYLRQLNWMPWFYLARDRQSVLGIATNATGTCRVPAAVVTPANQPNIAVLCGPFYTQVTQNTFKSSILSFTLTFWSKHSRLEEITGYAGEIKKMCNSLHELEG